ncbi:MAG: DUF2892 domain-containing protein [Acidocella sp.]|nr:DUF2892 domain-containing protein [Acidocella sp.]
MMKNVGGLDRILRVTVGLVLIIATGMHALPVWGYIGVVPLMTGLIGWCPAYMPFGIKTCSTK